MEQGGEICKRKRVMNSFLWCPKRLTDRNSSNGSHDMQDDAQRVVWGVSGAFRKPWGEEEGLWRGPSCADCKKDKKHTSSAQGTRAVLNCERIKTEGQGRLDRRRWNQGEKITLLSFECQPEHSWRPQRESSGADPFYSWAQRKGATERGRGPCRILSTTASEWKMKLTPSRLHSTSQNKALLLTHSSDCENNPPTMSPVTGLPPQPPWTHIPPKWVKDAFCQP